VAADALTAAVLIGVLKLDNVLNSAVPRTISADVRSFREQARWQGTGSKICHVLGVVTGLNGRAAMRSGLPWLCLGLVIALGACGAGGDAGPSSTSRADIASPTNDTKRGGPNPTAGRSGPVDAGAAMSCVEEYAPAAVARRAFAFYGVVLAIGASVSDRGDEGDLGLRGVTFEVREWFAGGSDSTVTVDLQGPGSESSDMSESGDAYGIGSRLLVSGESRWGGTVLESPIAWPCGFTRYYDSATANAWREAVGSTHAG
jgi:hypothetical protein